MGTTEISAGLVLDRNSAGNGTPAVGFRRALAALFRQSSPGVATPGRLGEDHFVVTGKTNMSYDVTGGGVVLVRSSAQGAYLVGSYQTVNVTTDPTGGTNPRWDRIYVHQPDPGLDGPSTVPGAIIGVAVGTPAPSPELPALPAGALELRRKLVGASAVNTIDGAAFTDQAPVTGLNLGGALPIAFGGTAATSAIQALQNLGIYVQPTQPAYADNRVWIKVPS
ncbi:hypothetical protein [Microbacterium lacus]|uniref:hypothetical protein n=1 Tax=Microbacterium lacus TaxID=415217 RepID=UPI000C2C5088|nr:hypothetical protein [Microbacterium lacus]